MQFIGRTPLPVGRFRVSVENNPLGSETFPAERFTRAPTSACAGFAGALAGYGPHMFGVLLATVIAFVAIAWFVLYVVRQEVAKRERVSAELNSPATPTLEYAVPTGQDPTVIVAALERAGYTA